MELTTHLKRCFPMPSNSKPSSNAGTMAVPNPDLEVKEGNKSRWACADYRRHSFHHLHEITRYSMSFRSRQVLPLSKRCELSIAAMDGVRYLASLPWFSAMVIIRDQNVLFERYAPDFGYLQPHSLQSISKTLVHLFAGSLVERGLLDLSRSVACYVPEIGSGYADAAVQNLLDMNVTNEYSEDFTDPSSTYFSHEEAMGWRLPENPGAERNQHDFLCSVRSHDTINRSGHVQYKDANTELLGWIVERAGGHPLRKLLADVADAAGLEGALHVTTDREGVPSLSGGLCLSARDVARYFSIFIREGCGVSGEPAGSAGFLRDSLKRGIPMQSPFGNLRYSNHLMVSATSFGHGGWGGQYVIANPGSGRIAVLLSVLENEHGNNHEYLAPVLEILEQVISE
jgi:hypothetical protein